MALKDIQINVSDFVKKPDNSFRVGTKPISYSLERVKRGNKYFIRLYQNVDNKRRIISSKRGSSFVNTIRELESGKIFPMVMKKEHDRIEGNIIYQNFSSRRPRKNNIATVSTGDREGQGSTLRYVGYFQVFKGDKYGAKDPSKSVIVLGSSKGFDRTLNIPSRTYLKNQALENAERVGARILLGDSGLPVYATLLRGGYVYYTTKRAK